MKVAAFPTAALAAQLSRSGISLRTGSFVIRVQSPIPSVAEGIAQLYADFSLADSADFADFHVRVAPPANLRRWFQPQVLFSLDGYAPFKPLPRAQAFAMFEWGLNWCVSNYCHRFLIIHAAVIERDGCAAILPAPPGAGKSTLCAALVNRGWRLLSDELALIGTENGAITPLPRPVSLKNESIAVIRRFAPGATLGHTVYDTGKGTVAHMKAPADSAARAGEAAWPAWIVFPQYQPGAAGRLAPRSKARTFMQVAQNAFNYSLLGEAGFQVVTGLIDACACYDFTYSSLDEAVAIFAALKPAAT